MSNPSSPSGRRLAAALLTALGLAASVGAQVTTGTLAGRVTAESDGSMLPGVTIEAVHEPTGAVYSAIAGEDGRFALPNVRVGGPYRVTATLDGFQTKEVSEVSVSLGATTEIEIPLAVAALEESIEVVGTADEFLNQNRTGAASAISLEQIETLPTLRRTLQDFARTNPYFIGRRTGRPLHPRLGRRPQQPLQLDPDRRRGEQRPVRTRRHRHAGRPADSAADLARRDQQLQLVVSPYDVRQGGFTGGGINAITRSGGNDFPVRSTAPPATTSFGRRRSTGERSAYFEQEQYGLRLGGRVDSRQAVLLRLGEVNRNEHPTGVSADGSTPNPVPESGARRRGRRPPAPPRYGYEPGDLGDFVGDHRQRPDLRPARLERGATTWSPSVTTSSTPAATASSPSERSTTRFRFPNSTYTQFVRRDQLDGGAAQQRLRPTRSTRRDRLPDDPRRRARSDGLPVVEIGGGCRAPRSSPASSGSRPPTPRPGHPRDHRRLHLR